MAKGYPDFGELQQVFETYKASIRTEPLLEADALDRLFFEAPARMKMLRRIRMQWAFTIGAVGVVTVAMVLLLGHTENPLPIARNASIGESQLPSASKPANPPIAATATRMSTMPKKNQSKTIQDSVQSANAGMLVFRTSQHVYPDNANLDSAVAHDPALGDGWRAADWNDLVHYNSGHPIQDIIKSLNWAKFGADTTGNYLLKARDQFWVRYNGRSETRRTEQHWEVITNAENSHRHYFVARMDGHVPKTFKVFAGINNNEVILGSWYDWKFPVLAVRRQDVH